MSVVVYGRSPMRKWILIVVMICVLLSGHAAMAVRVADITRIGGAQTSILTGLSLVTGLKGTGDGGDYMPAIRPLAGMLKLLNDAATVEELSKAQNVAVVSLTVRVPRNGVRKGEQTRRLCHEHRGRCKPAWRDAFYIAHAGADSIWSQSANLRVVLGADHD